MTHVDRLQHASVIRALREAVAILADLNADGPGCEPLTHIAQWTSLADKAEERLAESTPERQKHSVRQATKART